MIEQKHDSNWSEHGMGTRAVWAGELGELPHSASQMPVYQNVTFAYPDLTTWSRVARGEVPGHIYSRNSNPTVAHFEEKVRALEGAQAATSFSSGMAAISNTFSALLEPGDRVVSLRDTYGGTSKLFLEFLPRFGIEVYLCETGNHEEFERELGRGCQLAYLESPTNPLLEVMDIERLACATHEVDALLAVDNTFATPINQNPLALGADLVLHSATKFLGGHSDAMGGVVCGPAQLVKRIFQFREIDGAALHPTSAHLLSRGLKTLELRVERQNANALALCEYLGSHPAVETIHHPSLPEHPGHEIAKRQMPGGFGSVLSFSLRGGYAAVERCLPHLRFAHLAASLGAVGTLVGPPQVTSHVELSAEQRAQLGIPESLVRFSVGIENVRDVIADLEQALAFA